VLRSVAYRQGYDPEHAPAWCAVDLVIARTFGRWAIDNGRTSVLVDALTERLALRRVRVHLQTGIDRIVVADGRVAGVVTDTGRTIDVGAVVSTVDPWQLTDRLLPAPQLPRLRRAIRKAVPALAPQVVHELTNVATGPVEETVGLDRQGRPMITYTRPGLRTVHDFTAPNQDPAWGPAWTRRRDLVRRVPVTSELPGLFLAGAASPAGNGSSQVVQTGALASAACADYAERSGFPG
jgi:phytoene dehydrogenase-like protein